MLSTRINPEQRNDGLFSECVALKLVILRVQYSKITLQRLSIGQHGSIRNTLTLGKKPLCFLPASSNLVLSFRHQETKNKRAPLIYSVFLRFQPKGSQRNFSVLNICSIKYQKPWILCWSFESKACLRSIKSPFW